MPRTLSKIPAVALALLLAAAPAFAQATIGGEWRDDVTRFARQVVDEGLAPGLAVAVSQGEWILYAEGFGTADAETGRRATADTAFYIASSTKALTASAVVLRASRGEIDLDAPLSRYLPGLDLQPPLDEDSITVEELLTMTDGIDAEGPVTFRTAFTGELTPELLIELLAGYGPSEAGRGEYEYRNLPYNLLGLVLDPTGDGHGWKDVVAQEVLEPLGMGGTSARLSDLDPERIALPHSLYPGGEWRRQRLAKDDANLHAAGGHFTTARDLARYVAAQASHGRLEGERVFPAEAIASAHVPRVEHDRDFDPFERHAWSYGWDVMRWQGRTILSRFGSFSGYRSHMSFEPETGLGVVVITNGEGIASPAVDLVATYVYDRLIAADEDDPAGEYGERLAELVRRSEEQQAGLAEHLAERAGRVKPLAHPLDAFAGVYENPRMGHIELQVVAGGLELRAGVAGSRAEVYDGAEDLLRVVIGGGQVVGFEFSEGGGPAEALVLRGERYTRVDGR